jgi:hypothetical protein
MEQGWYDLLRSDQGDLEAYAEIGLMIDSASFIKDSLFCEWAYIINLDRGVLEVYRGFQTKKPKKNRYALSKEEIDELKADLKKRGKGYWMNEVDFRTGKVKKKIFHRNHAFYNCDLIAQIPLEIVPSFDMELFEKIVRDAEDEADVRGGNVIQVNKFGTEMIRSKVLLNVLCLNGYCEKPEVNDMYEPYFWKPQSNYDMTPSVIRNDVYLSEVFA